MSKEYMIIISKSPNQKPHITKIPKNLKYMKNLVGGNIEVKRYDDVLIMYNQNQQDINLKENRVFDDLKLKGNVLITGNNEIDGDIISLRKKQLVKYISKINGNNKDKEKEL